MTYDNRSTDGVTYNKIVVGLVGVMLSTVMGLLVFIYTSDQARAQKYQVDSAARIEKYNKESTERIEKTEVKLEAITISEAITYAHVANTDARLEKFIEESRAYWSRNNGQ